MSSRRRAERVAEMAVGLLFFAGLIALGYFTILLSHRDILGRKTVIRANFDSVGGLQRGDRILVRGMEAGKVSRLKLSDGRVQVVLLFDERPTIHENYKLRIRQSSVLGGRFVELDEGTPETPEVPLGTVLEGSPAFDLVADVEDLIGGMGDAIVWIRDAMREGGLIESLSQAGKDVSGLVSEIREGEGTIGLLIRDPALYTRAVETVDSFSVFAEDLKNASGTLPRLMHDPSLYEDAQSLLAQFHDFGSKLDTLGSNLDSLTTHLDRFSAQVTDGTGTLARLINDPSLYDDVQATAANLRTLTGGLAEGRGTVGKVLNDNGELYASLQNALNNLEAVSTSLRQGEGTMGKLMTDEQLYKDIQSLVTELRAVVEDFREQAPVTTFSGVMLGAF